MLEKRTKFRQGAQPQIIFFFPNSLHIVYARALHKAPLCKQQSGRETQLPQAHPAHLSLAPCTAPWAGGTPQAYPRTQVTDSNRSHRVCPWTLMSAGRSPLPAQARACTQSGQEAPARAASVLPCPARVSSAFLSHGLQPPVWQGRVRHEVTAPEQESQDQEEAYLSPY